MSVAQELGRINEARNGIRSTLVNWGEALSTDKINQLNVKLANIPNDGAVNAEVKEGESYTIPRGYHNGAGVVRGVAGGGNYSLQSKSVTPTKNQQSITPDSGYYGLSGVTVSPIPDNYQDTSDVTATANDVRAGTQIVDTDGNVVLGVLADGGDLEVPFDAVTEVTKTYSAAIYDSIVVNLTDDLEEALAAI